MFKTEITNHPTRLLFCYHIRLLSLMLGLSLLGVLLISCGDASQTGAASTTTSPNGNGNGSGKPTQASLTSPSTATPQDIAGEVVNSLKSGGAATGAKFAVSSQAAAANFPSEAKQAVQGRGSSYGSLFATDQYGLLLASTPWKTLDIAGIDGTKYSVLESEFQYQLTNGMARLGFAKAPNGWQLVIYRLDFDPPGVLSRSGKTDGLEKFQPKGFLEALNPATLERLDSGIEAVYGVDTGFIGVDSTYDRWKGRTKPFSISLNPALEGRSAQWLVQFDGRDKQRQSIIGTIRVLDGQPWGLFLDNNTGSPQKPELGFSLGAMKVDSVAACAKISYKPQCAKLGYDKDGWGIVLGS